MSSRRNTHIQKIVSFILTFHLASKVQSLYCDTLKEYKPPNKGQTIVASSIQNNRTAKNARSQMCPLFKGPIDQSKCPSFEGWPHCSVK